MYSIYFDLPLLKNVDFNSPEGIKRRDNIIEKDIVCPWILNTSKIYEMKSFGDENTPEPVKFQSLMDEICGIHLGKVSATVYFEELRVQYEKAVNEIFPEYQMKSVSEQEILARSVLKYANPLLQAVTLEKFRWENDSPSFCLRLMDANTFKEKMNYRKDEIIKNTEEIIEKRNNYIREHEQPEMDYEER